VQQGMPSIACGADDEEEEAAIVDRFISITCFSAPPPRRVIFLDVDNVLNTIPDKRLILIEEGPCKQLQRLLAESRAELVLTSPWHKHNEYVGQVLFNFGVSGVDGRVLELGQTPSLANASRRDLEILHWLGKQKRKVAGWVTLTAVDLLGWPSASRLQGRVVCVQEGQGLTEEHVDLALKYLDCQHEKAPATGSSTSIAAPMVSQFPITGTDDRTTSSFAFHDGLDSPDDQTPQSSGYTGSVGSGNRVRQSADENMTSTFSFHNGLDKADNQAPTFSRFTGSIGDNNCLENRVLATGCTTTTSASHDLRGSGDGKAPTFSRFTGSIGDSNCLEEHTLATECTTTTSASHHQGSDYDKLGPRGSYGGGFGSGCVVSVSAHHNALDVVDGPTLSVQGPSFESRPASDLISAFQSISDWDDDLSSNMQTILKAVRTEGVPVDKRTSTNMSDMQVHVQIPPAPASSILAETAPKEPDPNASKEFNDVFDSLRSKFKM